MTNPSPFPVVRQVSGPFGPLAVSQWTTSAVATLVFLHGWGGARQSWQPVAQSLAAGFNVVSLDLSGHGESPAGGGPWSIARFAAEVASVLDALVLENVVLIGHSMGGAVVTEAAIARPAVVQAVVLVDTFIFDYGHVAAEECQAILSGIKADLPGTAKAMVANTTPVTTPEALRESIAAVMSQLDVRVGVSAFADLLAWDATPRWPLLGSIPVHAINGDLINAAARQRHAGIIHEVIVSGTGHFLQLEAPERFREALLGVIHALPVPV